MLQPNRYTIVTGISGSGDRVGVGCLPALPKEWQDRAEAGMGTHARVYDESFEFDYFQEEVVRNPSDWVAEKVDFLERVIAEATKDNPARVSVLSETVVMGGGSSLFEQYREQHPKNIVTAVRGR